MIALLAASAALAFAPPLDRPLRYDTTERRPRPDGTMRGATLTQEVVFAADAGGYTMTIRTTGYRPLPPPAQSGDLDAVMKPMVGSVVRLHLSPGGVPVRVIDGEAGWAAMLASLRASIAARPPADPLLAPARAMLAALDATPPDARDARLIAAADDLLGTKLPPIAIGAHAERGRDLIEREADTGSEARYRERSTQEIAGRVLRTDCDVAVSRTTGLVAHSVRRTAITGDAGDRLVSETETALIL